ncbi:DUF4406 domain-containing protein [Enterobacter oligotrophicus]|uniref:DUF4406 domain-containing protein n=1 Tax=Enterobacter oligotrophicus TaxID=2478464 RepID=UPI0023F4F782|nr:DUF4406 domain-containing protein [Enterobacter oligotrophicus]
MKIFISGPMTGHEDFNRKEFNAEADRLTRHGHAVLNPATLPDGLSERNYIDICMTMLSCAEGILMLPGWQKSAGATTEYHYAYRVGMPVYTTLNYPPVE